MPEVFSQDLTKRLKHNTLSLRSPWESNANITKGDGAFTEAGAGGGLPLAAGALSTVSPPGGGQGTTWGCPSFSLVSPGGLSKGACRLFSWWGAECGWGESNQELPVPLTSAEAGP